MAKVTFTDYSEKAFALSGDTKEIKEQIMAANGKYSPNLRVGKGWIFSKAKQAPVLEKIKASGKTEFDQEEILALLKSEQAAA